jgi:tripartite-type tricarboxylate transporter receptor subunit TctC
MKAANSAHQWQHAGICSRIDDPYRSSHEGPMKFSRRRFLHLAAGTTALPALPHIASAQTYPSRPVTLAVPFAPGGPTDTIARIMAERLRPLLGQPIIVENTTGAGGTIGVGRAARAAPDGYTISLGQNGSHVVTGASYSNLPYDLLADFEPLSLICTSPFVITSRKSVPANNLESFIAWLKANPGNVTVGTAGQGSITHVCGLVFQNATGTSLRFVPYRGTAPAMQDLISGQIDMMISDPVGSISYARSGLIRAYAVAADARLPSAPDVPTVDEAGLPGYHVSLWHGLWLPKGTPKDIIIKLNAAVTTALADPVARTRLAELGQDIFAPNQQTPDALSALQRADIQKWWPIIKASNFKVE